MDRRVSTERAISRDQLFDAQVCDRANNEFQGITVDRLRKGPEFPGAQMTGQINDAVAAANGFGVVFKSVDDDVFRDIFTRELRKVTELHKQPADIPKTAAQDLKPFVLRLLRKGEFEIAHARPA